jgi:surface protein
MRVVYNNLSGCFTLCDIDTKNKPKNENPGGLLGGTAPQYTPITDDTIHEAVHMYMEDKFAKYGPIKGWDTSKVTNMSTVFYQAKAFNADISKWNTSNVENMNSMFNLAKAFNQNIESWDTSKVESMTGMLQGANAFNQNIESWNTSKVESMSGMFYNAKTFNQDISKWNTSNVNYMPAMFQGAKIFNQNISNWNISKVGDNYIAFGYASSLCNAGATSKPIGMKSSIACHLS